MENVGRLTQWLTEQGYHIEIKKDTPKITDSIKRTYVLAEPKGNVISEKEYDKVREIVNSFGYELKIGHNVIAKERSIDQIFSIMVD